MIRGSCLCGAVRYAISTPLEEMHHCHCSRCRKAHGAAFSTFARVEEKDLELLSGKDKVRDFQSSAPVKRSFCADCGSQLFFRFAPLPEAAWVAVGTFDDDPDVRPQGHIFATSKAPWHDITDSLPQYEGYPPQD